MSMQNTFLYFLSMLVESIALSCCILAVFRDQKDLRKRDFILVPSVSLCLLIARSSYGGASPGFHLTQGFFLAPADNFPILLILLMGLLLLTSTLLNTQDGGRTFCGTMAAFSLYLLCHFCAVIFTIFFNLTSSGIAVVSSVVTLLLCIFVVCLPWFQGLRSALRTGSFLVQVLSINVTLFFTAVCACTSFDPIRFMAHWKFIAFLLLPLLFLDIVLWMINTRQEEQRKQIRMTEQYPLFVVLPVCWNLHQERKNNFLVYVQPRVPMRKYLWVKWMVYAISAFCIITIPYILSAVTALRMDPHLDALNMGNRIFENTYSEYPVVYAVTLSVFRGLIGVLVMTMGFFLAMYCENIFVVLTGPFLYTILENFLLAILGVPQYRLVTAFDPNCLSPEVITTMSFVAGPSLLAAVIILLAIYFSKVKKEKVVKV